MAVMIAQQNGYNIAKDDIGFRLSTVPIYNCPHIYLSASFVGS
jgi:hypothetical protein